MLFWFLDDFERRKRMLKSRWMSGLMALALVLTFAQSGLAQINLSVTGNPSPVETATNLTADTNDPISGGNLFILGTALSDADVSIGGLRLTYPSTITSTTTFPPTDAINIVSATGFFSTVTTADIRVNYEDGILEINLPNVTTAVNGDTGTISIGGVRIDANELDVDAEANADVALFVGSTSESDDQTDVNVGPSNINVNLQTSEITVIEDVQPGIDEVEVGEGTVSTTGSILDGTIRIDITEGHDQAWLDSTQIPGSLNDAGLRLVFNDIPEGFELTLSESAGTGRPSFAISDTSIDADDNETIITWDDPTNLPDPNDQDEIRITVTIADVDADEISAGDEITVQVSMNPDGEALEEGPGDDEVPVDSELPRFTEDLTDEAVVITVVPATSTLLIPYATRIASIGYDTGIAIANTSLDPAESVDAQSGVLTFDFFPNDGDGPGEPFSFTTDGPIAGTALNADGELEGGATFIALLSTLLAEAGQTGDFAGYIFVETQFQYAHGAAFISDFSNFTSATNVLVMDNLEFDGRTDSTESLGF